MTNNIIAKHPSFTEKKNDESHRRSKEKSNSTSGSNGAHIGLKSNLKKATTVMEDEKEENQLRRTDQNTRKVSWPDDHGKDIAHVHEFETSMSEDGELEGVRNSCVCAIQ